MDSEEKFCYEVFGDPKDTPCKNYVRMRKGKEFDVVGPLTVSDSQRHIDSQRARGWEYLGSRWVDTKQVYEIFVHDDGDIEITKHTAPPLHCYNLVLTGDEALRKELLDYGRTPVAVEDVFDRLRNTQEIVTV
jgi:hypothetical protein